MQISGSLDDISDEDEGRLTIHERERVRNPVLGSAKKILMKVQKIMNEYSETKRILIFPHILINSDRKSVV